MNQRDRKILTRFFYAWQAIPQAKETSTLPTEGWRMYSQDMRDFQKAARDLFFSMILPEDDYPPTENVMAGIEAWIEKRKAESWGSTWGPIEYDYGDETE